MCFLVRVSFLLLFSSITRNFDVTAADRQVDYDEIDSLDDLKARVVALEEKLQKLSDVSDASRRPVEEPCGMAIQLLATHFGSIDGQLKSLQMDLKERAEIEDTKYYLNDIVQAIQSKHFKVAGEKLNKMGDLAQIPKIVYEVYAGSQANFDLLVSFAESLPKITASYQVLAALSEELSKNDHDDPNKLIILAKTLKREVMGQHSDPNGIKADASVIIDNLVDKIKKTAAESLFAAMKSDDYQLNANVQKLAEDLYDYSPEVSDEVMERLVDVTFGTVATKKILANLFSHSKTSQALSGISALFWKIKDAGSLNDSVVLDLASTLSKLLANDEFTTLSLERKEAANTVVENIPMCARNLFFQPTACLWNKGRAAYMHAASLSLKHDRDRRNIFTSTPTGSSARNETKPSGAAWLVEKVGDSILFKSNKYKNEYLYAAAIDYSPEMHYVFNWIPGGNTDKQSEWNIELDGDYCYLKSAHFNEYLFAPGTKYQKNENFSYVFTWKPGTSGGNSDFVWQIRNC